MTSVGVPRRVSPQSATPTELSAVMARLVRATQGPSGAMSTTACYDGGVRRLSGADQPGHDGREVVAANDRGGRGGRGAGAGRVLLGAGWQRPLPRQVRRSHQALIDGAGALAAFADGPDDQRLAAAHV